MFYVADLLGWNGNREAQERCPAAPGLGMYPVTPHPWWILIEGADEPDWSGMLSKASLQNLLPCEINASNIPVQPYSLQQELNCPVSHGLSKRTNPQLVCHGSFCSGVFGNSLQVPPFWDLPKMPFPEGKASFHCHVEGGPAHAGAWNQVSSNPNYSRLLSFWDDHLVSSPFSFFRKRKPRATLLVPFATRALRSGIPQLRSLPASLQDKLRVKWVG